MDEDGGLSGRRVVVGVTGGIAAYKAPLMVRGLCRAGATVDVVLSRAAATFVGAPTFEGLTGRTVHTGVFDDVAGATHVGLARDADVVVVYPATAHLLARAAHGLADDLLTTTLLAAACPVVLAPAMHSGMWTHPATVANVDMLSDRGVVWVGPHDGPLMRGDAGPGRAAEPSEVVAAVHRVLAGRADLAGRTVVVTAGGTREAIDPVRFLGNRSTGRMGFAVADAAARRGADVVLVAAPTHLAAPAGVSRVDVVSARDMHAAVLARADADVIVKAAAVADFRPTAPSARKLAKADGTPSLELEPNPDILAELGRNRAQHGTGPAVLVGFAAETHDIDAHARRKLAAKGCDLLVVNDVTATDAGFGHDTNRVVVLSATDRLEFPLATKREVADWILDAVVDRLP